MIGEIDTRGAPIVGDTLLLMVNAHAEELPFRLPATKEKKGWQRMLDTALDFASDEHFREGDNYRLQGRSLVLLKALDSNGRSTGESAHGPGVANP
jgi:glycogen operon protein